MCIKSVFESINNIRHNDIVRDIVNIPQTMALIGVKFCMMVHIVSGHKDFPYVPPEKLQNPKFWA